jgi:hypothetical protein
MTVTASAVPDPLITKPRRWIPVSLKIFVAMLSVLGAASAWIGVPAYRQHSAVQEIKRLGGRVHFLSDTRPPTWLEQRVGTDWTRFFDEVIAVNLEGTQVTDSDLNGMNWPMTVWWLDLSSTRITDATLVHVARLRKLRHLGLHHTRVTDSGLACLKELPNLRSLLIRKSRVTDTGLADLRRELPRLTIRQQ